MQKIKIKHMEKKQKGFKIYLHVPYEEKEEAK